MQVCDLLMLFSKSLAYLFFLLIMSFEDPKFSVVMKSNLSVCSFMDCDLESFIKIIMLIRKVKQKEYIPYDFVCVFSHIYKLQNIKTYLK